MKTSRKLLAALAAMTVAFSGFSALSAFAEEGAPSAQSSVVYDAAETKEISDCRISFLNFTFTYTGKEVCPDNYGGSCYLNIYDGRTRLVKDVDYKLSYANNINTGIALLTIEGVGKYQGTAKYNYYVIPKKQTIKGISYTKEGIRLEWVPDSTALAYQVLISQNYNFKGALSYTIKDISSSGTVIKNKFGTNERWYVKVRSVITQDGTFNTRRYGDFSATRSIKTFPQLSKIEVTNNSLNYTGSEIKPAVKVTDANGAAVSADDYTVKYTNNIKAGIATVTATNNSDPSNVVKAEFVIKPAVNRITNITTQNGAFKISWEKGSPGTVGYQVYYSTSSDFSSNVHSYTSTDLNDLEENFSSVPKSGETWYVKVRSFCTASGTKTGMRYGDYSAVQSIHVIDYLAKTTKKTELYANAAFSPSSLGSVPAGSTVSIIGATGCWFKAEFGGKTGYIYNKAFGVAANVTGTVTEANVKTYADDIIFDIGTSAKAICSYVHNLIWYTHTAVPTVGRDGLAAYAFNYRRGACYYYAATTDILLERAGYEHKLVKGRSTTGEHHWSMYRTTGTGWLYLDSCPFIVYPSGFYDFTGYQVQTIRQFTWNRAAYET